ncbi:hypothetical protein C9374_011020 [Naegleria lovaniensis]|uniref:3-hydroxyisobutyryl-CoA hydrolase n=1 Tax=Naegleria lovaniensis TaxID=51637 RepID=A0AA88GFE4_NAELO|nr:uncharacterized protein C9374_011020 [Naegleria lovaniensis]KAG2374183.1 hypothetical protein C9374_011020 [Naegleria lovaniensis]
MRAHHHLRRMLQLSQHVFPERDDDMYDMTKCSSSWLERYETSGRVLESHHYVGTTLGQQHIINGNQTSHSENDSNVVFTDFNQENHCLRITLNRPKSFNALSLTMIRKLTKILEQALEDSNVHFVMLSSSNEKAFCAGGDIKDLRKGIAKVFFTEEFALNHFIYEFCKKKPIVSMLNGITMGGGVGISISTNLRVANEQRYVFAMPEVFIGLYPDIGASWFLTQSCPNMAIARYIGLTGEKLKAHDALYCKLVTHIIDKEEHFKKLAHDIYTVFKSSSTNGDFTTVLKELTQFISKYEKEARSSNVKFGILDRYRRVIDYCFGEENAKSVKDVFRNLRLYIEQHPSRCDADIVFIQSILELFEKRASPTSLLVTFEALNRGKKSNSLKQVLDMDKILCTHLTVRHDFLEGVRAVLIDRDQKPKFKPATLEEIDEMALVQEVFSEKQ